jgi:hypothetical protein
MMRDHDKFDRFHGRHWETGSIHNALALQGFVAPHTGRPFSEALMLGVSGGITFAYIYQCLQLFTEKPPKGAAHNFGFAAYQRLADLLVNTRNKQSWERLFAPGKRMVHALAGAVGQPGAYSWIQTWGAADGAERGLYADFLVEAAEILKKPALNDSAELFRESYSVWCEFADALLPDAVPLLGESKHLIQRKHDLFIEQGDSALPEIKKINARLNEILAQSETNFPLSQAEVVDFRAHLRDILLKISAVEQRAVERLQQAVM